MKAKTAHLSGDCNVFGDAVSRSLWRRFFSLCRAVGVQPVQLPPPPALCQIIERLAAFGRARGQEIRTSSSVGTGHTMSTRAESGTQHIRAAPPCADRLAPCP